MFFTKKHKLALEQEIAALRDRAYQNELAFQALQQHLGLAVMRNWGAPTHIVVKAEEAKRNSGAMGLVGSTNFKLK